MSDIESAGAAVTAGLVAAAIDGQKKKGDRVKGVCANCGSQIDGKFCAECGQPANIHRTLGHMGAEFLRGIFNLDTRAWKTVPLLLFRPGTLTSSYIHGQRARYISPLAMFLLSVFTMFVVFGFTNGSRIGVSDPVQRAAAVEDARTELGQARQQVQDALARRGITTGDLDADATDDNVDKGADEATDSGDSDTTRTLSLEDGSIYDEIRKSAENGELNVNTGWPALDANLRENLLHPELAVYKIQNAAYENAFLLVPISLPLIWLLFIWRRGTTWFDHSVYILYSLSFVSLLFILISLLSMIPGAAAILVGPLLIASCVHSYFHLKGGYGLSWFSAAWRLPFQLAFALIGLTIYLIVIIVLGLVG
ncbi:MAG TPA: DUF3667 domain-containing protein [Hyphomonadaceae bacterium]|nr:DUF3667 domain-containing protein [Hyphomonadaceae bacterium]